MPTDLKTFGEYAVTFCTAGAVVVIIRLLAKSGNTTLAGMLFMFPVISLTSLSFLMLAGTPTTKLQTIAINGLYGLPSIVTFLLVYAMLVKRMNGAAALAISLAVWFVITFLVVQIKNRVQGT